MPALRGQSGIAGYGDRGSEVDRRDDPERRRHLHGRGHPAVGGRDRAGGRRRRPGGARCAPASSSTGAAARSRRCCCRSSSAWAARSAPASSTSRRSPSTTGSARATYLALNDHTSGVYNLTGPDPSTNAEFTEELARALHRPAKLRVPAFAAPGRRPDRWRGRSPRSGSSPAGCSRRATRSPTTTSPTGSRPPCADRLALHGCADSADGSHGPHHPAVARRSRTSVTIRVIRRVSRQRADRARGDDPARDHPVDDPEPDDGRAVPPAPGRRAPACAGPARRARGRRTPAAPARRGPRARTG